MTYSFIIHPRHDYAKVRLEAFADGLRRHGISPVFSAEPWSCDVAVVWGWRLQGLITAQQERGGRVLVMEQGYIGNRAAWTSIGWDGLNGRATFPEPPDDTRWREKLAPHMKPWTDRAGPVVVMGQCPGDAAVDGTDIVAWAAEACRYLAARGETVRYRPHPLAPDAGLVKGAVHFDTGPLEDTLAIASRVVTFNSNSGVDAVMAGVPTVAMDRGSMVWGLADESIDDPPGRPDRDEWGKRIAYRQWTLGEIRRGEAWEHLKRGLEGATDDQAA